MSKIVNNLAELTKWEKVYKASLSVDKLIDNIKIDSSTFESKTLSAQTAFEKLAQEERTWVQKRSIRTIILICYFIEANQSFKTYYEGLRNTTHEITR